jgi:hypothetical protein
MYRRDPHRTIHDNPAISFQQMYQTRFRDTDRRDHAPQNSMKKERLDIAHFSCGELVRKKKLIEGTGAFFMYN